MSTMCRAVWVTLVSMLTAFAVQAAAEGPGSQVERAYLVGSVETLESLLSELEVASGGTAEPAALYDSALAAWRLSDLLRDAPKSKKRRRQALLKQAREDLEELVDRRSDDAEALALLGGVLGEMIGKSMFRGMTLGPRASATLDQAADLAPGNPRVALQRGIGYFFTPGLFGVRYKESNP